MPTSEPSASADWCERHSRRLLVALLVVSFALRVWLAGTGGQGYWPDEMRYTNGSRAAAWHFAHNAPREAWLALIGTADHLLFKIFGVPIAMWELHHGANNALVASYFGFFSVLALGLIFAIARAVGAGARESLLAVFFAAAANSLFYYSRHLFPYDLSLFFCLLALWLALGRAAWWRSLGAGLAASGGFLAYNGYWLLSGVVLVYHVLRRGIEWRMFARAGWAGLGLVLPIVIVIAGARILDRDLIASFREFSGTITQGDFGRGWIFVWQYLWETEGALLLVWLALSVAGLCFLRGDRMRRILLWLGGAAIIYAGLVFCADVVRSFVIYGRTARVVVPFLCLAAAAGATGLASRWPRRWSWLILLVGVTAAAGWHMATGLAQMFPGDFLLLAKARAHVAQAKSRDLLRVLNADRLAEGKIMGEPRPHVVLLQRSHPLQLAPYPYEGIGEDLRRRFAVEDISMQLVAVPSVTLPDIGGGYLGPLRLKVVFPTNRIGISEPLLSSGELGRANFIYVQYSDASHVRVGYDCWNYRGILSAPIEIDFAREHEVLLSSGAQLSPVAGPPAGIRASAWSRLQGSVLVMIDGKVAVGDHAATNLSDPRSVFLGTNFVGGSSAREGFSGEIRSVSRATWKEVLSKLEVDDLTAEEASEELAASSPSPDWSGYPGPLRLRVRFPRTVSGQPQPLLVSGVAGAGDFVFVRYLGDGRVTFGFDHWGVGGPESAPVTLMESRKADIVVTHGGLMPPKDAKVYESWPELSALRDSILITVDDRTVLTARAVCHPSDPGNIAAGRNFIGGSTASAKFEGEIFSIISEPAAAVIKRVNRVEK